jgi:hypothetical protein
MNRGRLLVIASTEKLSPNTSGHIKCRQPPIAIGMPAKKIESLGDFCDGWCER